MLTTSSAVHPAILKRFKTLIQNGKLGHAFLFIGPKAVGKGETARAIAKLLNCEVNADGHLDVPCGACYSCRKIEVDAHPDVAFLDSKEEESIKIAAIREVIQRLQLKAYEGRTKVVIIQDVELMTAESANAFLKTLEEPPRDTVLLLTTSSPELILSTIKSRCQQVHFFASARGQVASALVADQWDQKTAHFLSHYTDGCLGRAKELGDQNFIQRKNKLLDELVLNRNNDRFLKDLLGEKTAIREALEVLLTWFRDLLFVKAGTNKEELTHVDRVTDLERLACVYSKAQLLSILSEIENSLKNLDENLNVKIAFYLLMEKIWVK